MIEYNTSKATQEAAKLPSTMNMVDGDEQSMAVLSSQNNTTAHKNGHDMTNEEQVEDDDSFFSNTEIKAVTSSNKKLVSKNTTKLTDNQDIVQEEEEKESSNGSSIQSKPRAKKDDDMASVDVKPYHTDSENSETSIKRMEGSFNDLNFSKHSRRSSQSTQRFKRKLSVQRSFVSERDLKRYNTGNLNELGSDQKSNASDAGNPLNKKKK